MEEHHGRTLWGLYAAHRAQDVYKRQALACADRIFELIEETPQTPEPADAKTLTDPDGSVALEDRCV